MKWIFPVLIALASPAAFAGEESISALLMKECRIKAANAAVEIYPAFQIRSIGTPTFLEEFESKDELGEPITGQRYKGKMEFVVGDIEGIQHFSCTFIRYRGKEWMVSYAGLGPTE